MLYKHTFGFCELLVRPCLCGSSSPYCPGRHGLRAPHGLNQQWWWRQLPIRVIYIYVSTVYIIYGSWIYIVLYLISSWNLPMVVSENVRPQNHPKWIIFNRETNGFGVPQFTETPAWGKVYLIEPDNIGGKSTLNGHQELWPVHGESTTNNGHETLKNWDCRLRHIWWQCEKLIELIKKTSIKIWGVYHQTTIGLYTTRKGGGTINTWYWYWLYALVIKDFHGKSMDICHPPFHYYTGFQVGYIHIMSPLVN